MPHVRFQVPFLGPESQLKSGFACAGLLCKSGHAAKDCWAKDLSKRPGASPTPKPSAKPKAKPAAKSKGSKGRGKGGKFREVEEGEESCEAEKSQEPEVEQKGGNQAAMVVSQVLLQ